MTCKVIELIKRDTDELYSQRVRVGTLGTGLNKTRVLFNPET